jgi:hypothetical protein
MFNSTEESFKQPSFQDLWKELHPLLESDEFSANCKGKKKVLRVVLTDLSSPVWADPEKLPTFLGLVKTFLRFVP